MTKQEKTRVCPVCGKQVAPRGYFTHIRLAHPGLEERTIVRQEDNKMDKLKGLPIETQNKINRIIELRKLRAEVEKSDDKSFLDGLFSDDDTQEVLLDRIDTEIEILREEIREETENLKAELGIED
jgi:predicted sugar kinase